MTYRKFKAGKVFDGRSFLNTNAVLITDPEGIVQDIVVESAAGDGIENFDGILCPGFVNAHCHLELSHMKGVIPPKTGMTDFLIGVVGQRQHDIDLILHSIAEAEEQMFNNGIIAVGDICNTTHTINQKKQGRLYYHNFIEVLGFNEARATEIFEAAEKTFAQFASAYSTPVESNSIVPHAPYTVSSALFKKIADFPGNHLISIHNQESREENEFFVSASGEMLRLYKTLGIDISFHKAQQKSSVQIYIDKFHRNQTILLVHNVHTSQADLDFIKQNARNPDDIYFCLCPNANMYITETLPDIEMLVKNEMKIVIGTDSLASNHQLNILEELKTIQVHNKKISLKSLLGWATLNGAEALQMEAGLGSFEKGKQPGIVLIQQVAESDDLRDAVSKRIL